MKEEVWKDVDGFDGVYIISNLGRVKSFKKGPEGIILKPAVSNCYLSLVLSKNGKPHMRKIHRLVATAFVPNPHNYPIINHIDCNKLNNVATNLEWATLIDNSPFMGIILGNIKTLL